jgi:ribosome-associated translation inhibitor RaiA
MGVEDTLTISVRGYGIEVDPGLGGLVERRLSFALSRFGGRVRAVAVSLVDMNGPRGGIDKKCSMQARLAPRGSVRVEDTDSELPAAVDRAATRLARAVVRALERRREASNGGGVRRETRTVRKAE